MLSSTRYLWPRERIFEFFGGGGEKWSPYFYAAPGGYRRRQAVVDRVRCVDHIRCYRIQRLATVAIMGGRFTLIPPTTGFAQLPVIKLTSIRIDSGVRGGRHIFMSGLTIFLPRQFRINGGGLYFQLQAISKRCFVLNSNSHPCSLVASASAVPSALSSEYKDTVITACANVLPLLHVVS